MVYAEAMEKAVGGFRELHKSRVITPKSSVLEWEIEYTKFMNKHRLPLKDEPPPNENAMSHMEDMSDK